MDNTDNMDNIDKDEEMQDLSRGEEPFSDDDIDDDDIEIIACDEDGVELEEGVPDEGARNEAAEARNEYLRLYAEFDNYRKRVAKDKQELSKFASESMVLDLLPSLDHLEIALKHARESEGEDSPKDGLVEGVEMTLRELLRTLEKHGVRQIEARGMPFDPEFHHAVSQVERDDMDEGMVVDELRKGYVYNGKVIRATMVSVSKAPETT